MGYLHGYDGPTGDALADVRQERYRQDDKWGEQNHQDGTGSHRDQLDAVVARNRCKGNGPHEHNWRDILDEEVREAFAETDPVKLRAELVQVAAVAAAWIECIDRRPTLAQECGCRSGNYQDFEGPLRDCPIHGEKPPAPPAPPEQEEKK